MRSCTSKYISAKPQFWQVLIWLNISRTYFCALDVFSVKVWNYTSIKSQYFKATNDDINRNGRYLLKKNKKSLQGNWSSGNTSAWWKSHSWQRRIKNQTSWSRIKYALLTKKKKSHWIFSGICNRIKKWVYFHITAFLNVHKVILEWPLAIVYTIHLKVSSLVSPSGLTQNQGCERELVEVYGLHAQSGPQSNYFPWTKGTQRVASAYCSGNGQCLPEDSSPDFHHALGASTLGHWAEALRWSQLAFKAPDWKLVHHGSQPGFQMWLNCGLRFVCVEYWKECWFGLGTLHFRHSSASKQGVQSNPVNSPSTWHSSR